MELFLLYGASVVVSFLVLCDAWRREFDLEIGEAIIFACVSALPCLGLIVYFFFWVSGLKGFIVWRKK